MTHIPDLSLSMYLMIFCSLDAFVTCASFIHRLDYAASGKDFTFEARNFDDTFRLFHIDSITKRKPNKVSFVRIFFSRSRCTIDPIQWCEIFARRPPRGVRPQLSYTG